MNNSNPPDSDNQQFPVILSPREQEAIEAEIQRELQRLGQRPSLDDLRRQGLHEPDKLNRALDLIAGVGRVINLLVAETIHSIAALTIALVFGILEYWRVYNGAVALGQTESQAALIGYAVVTANIVVPIWMLRQLRGRTAFEVKHQTVRGYLSDFWYRLIGRPRVEQADLYYNPTLNFATMILTYGTIFLAIYDLLSPLLTSIFEGHLGKPIPILILELMMGLALSLAGVFFLQSAAHAIGARTLTDNPRRLSDMLELRRAEYDRRAEDIRVEVRERHEAAKVARLQARATRQIPAVSKTTSDTSRATPKRRNRNAQADLAEWFKSQPSEVLEMALAGQMSLRQIGEMAGVDKEIVRRYLVALKASTSHQPPNENGTNGRH